MGFESFVARRYLRSGSYFTSVSTWITIAGVTLGVAVVCFVMSMHNGFESEIRARLLGTTSHISIFPLNGLLIEDYENLVETLEEIDGVVAASPFIYYKVAISSASAGDGIVLRGIDSAREALTSNIVRDISVGDYSFEVVIDEENNDTIPGMILGSHVAERLGVFLGQPVLLYSLRGEDLVARARPRVSKFHISGIFETGMYEFDSQLAYISLEEAQKLFRTGDAVTAVHLKLNDNYQAELIAPEIDSVLQNRYNVVPWNELHSNLFAWISIEKKILFLGFILIVIVAAFSIISTLVMLTMEKRPDIGILKTIGSTSASIRKIFIFKGVAIGSMGVLGGWALSLLAGYVQNRYEIVSLPADIYFISYLPLEIHFADYALTGVATFVICLLAAIYPAHKAAKLEVVDVLRR